MPDAGPLPPGPLDDVDDMDEAGDEDVWDTGPWAPGDDPAADALAFMDTGGGDLAPGGADVVKSCGELMPLGVAVAVTSYLHWTPVAEGMPPLLFNDDDMGDMAPGDGRPPAPPPCCRCCR